MNSLNFSTLGTLLWTAPEHLRQKRAELHGSQKGDMYSFAIVLQEIVSRTYPFEKSKALENSHEQLYNPSLIIRRVRAAELPPYRPSLSDGTDCPPFIQEIITACWDEIPENRPAFSVVKQQFKKATK